MYALSACNPTERFVTSSEVHSGCKGIGLPHAWVARRSHGVANIAITQTHMASGYHPTPESQFGQRPLINLEHYLRLPKSLAQGAYAH